MPEFDVNVDAAAPNVLERQAKLEVGKLEFGCGSRTLLCNRIWFSLLTFQRVAAGRTI